MAGKSEQTAELSWSTLTFRLARILNIFGKHNKASVQCEDSTTEAQFDFGNAHIKETQTRTPSADESSPSATSQSAERLRHQSKQIDSIDKSEPSSTAKQVLNVTKDTPQQANARTKPTTAPVLITSSFLRSRKTTRTQRVSLGNNHSNDNRVAGTTNQQRQYTSRSEIDVPLRINRLTAEAC